MFENDFSERLENRTDFVFDENIEMCSEQEFCKFLHYAIGCRPKSECVLVDSAGMLASILFVSIQISVLILKLNVNIII